MDIMPNSGILFAQIMAIVVIGLASLAFWIWTLIDCIRNEPSAGNDKVIWVLVIVLLHSLGALIYLIARRPTRIMEAGR